MLCTPSTDHHFKILTDNEVKDFVTITFSEYIKSTRKKLTKWRAISKKFAELRYIFLARHDEVKKYVEIMQSNSFDNCVHWDWDFESFSSKISTDHH